MQVTLNIERDDQSYGVFSVEGMDDPVENHDLLGPMFFKAGTSICQGHTGGVCFGSPTGEPGKTNDELVDAACEVFKQILAVKVAA